VKKLLVLALFALSSFAADRPAAKYFGGITLVDQNGRTVDLYKDLMADHTVVINSFFASCAGSCPVMAHTLAAMQSRFGDRLGKELVIISITVDPANDTPERLREYAKKAGAKNGWYFLTGSKEQVDFALRKLGQATATREDHMNIFVVGNDRTGLWKKGLGLAKADDVAELVRSVLDDRGE
jgi:protein SCO1/2